MRAQPAAARRALERLGNDLSVARRRRRIPTGLMAERAFISRNTLARVERGDASVSMGIYATVLFLLGGVERLGALMDASQDPLGQGLEQELLPRRIRSGRGDLGA
jgi:transcriptional regulator with XRE-family HTH domain